MALVKLINIEQLVQAFDDDNPAGQDIRDDASATSPYQIIKGERQAARAAERKSLFDEGNHEANQHWHKILELAPEILTDHAKDLEIACWYTEALTRRHGFAGLRSAFELIEKLLENFWDQLYPAPDEDGIVTRVAPLAGLNGEGAEGVLIAPIRNIPITEDVLPGPFSIWQYQQARGLQKITDEDARAEKASKVGFTVEDIEKAVNASSENFYVDLQDEVQTCIEVYRRISQNLTERCGVHDAPPTSNINHTLEDYLSTLNHIAGHKFPVAESPNTADGAETSSGSGSTGSGPISSREQAFTQLRAIAQFFRQAEPHSPISYLLDKAVKWGGMSLNELIPELIPDSSSRNHYSDLTGVRVEDDN